MNLIQPSKPIHKMNKYISLSFVLLLSSATAFAQFISSIELTTNKGVGVSGYTSNAGTSIQCKDILPLFTFELNGALQSSLSTNAKLQGDSIVWTTNTGIDGSVRYEKKYDRGWKGVVTFRNVSTEKKTIANVVPLGESPNRVYIRADESEPRVDLADLPYSLQQNVRNNDAATYIHRLSRSKLFRPGVGAIGVVLPDNAWEMGFCDVQVNATRSLAAIARRTSSEKAEIRRFRTILEPDGFVQYAFYVDDHGGDWRDGLRIMFQERWIYDLETFDNTLFERKDLEWIRHSYLLLLQFVWDHQYYDAKTQKYNYDQFLLEQNSVLGGYEAYMIWPTWPRLGLDARNQWDMYRDLPGGIPELRRQVEYAHRNNTKYFIAYNPWDQSTRNEEHAKGMEEMLRAINADGVVLDTWGESNKEFQDAADRAKPGVILYSEGMAVPKDMPTIVSGRVHDAIYMAPPLNLNKFIKPEFSIFRVCQLAEGRIHREIAVSFFNGYGTEMNIMRPGRPDWIDEEYAFLGRTTKILRENSSAYLSRSWVPLLPTLTDSIWVNKFPTPSKTLYNIYSLKPEGWNGALFEVSDVKDSHYVSLWNHKELELVTIDGKTYAPVTIDGFSRSWIGTRREGNVDCIAMFPKLLKVSVNSDSLHVEANVGKRVVVWAGNPSYKTKFADFSIGRKTISLLEHLGRHEEKFVVQLFDDKELLDERIVYLNLATPRLISRVEQTMQVQKVPSGMVEIPAGVFTFKPRRSFLSPNEVIPYPGDSTIQVLNMKRFFMDQYPVTNEEFGKFLKESKYRPNDTTHFLKHWMKGNPPKGLERHPVVYISLDDAKAYATWAGKRLPTDIEWQYAAQGTDGRKYPWGEKYDSTKCNHSLGYTTAVDAFPQGRSPFGVMDLIGNVWQLTNDIYDNGTFYFGMIRGGSHYNPISSWWYIPGGPQPADNPQILLLVSPGFDRSATVGFRCVKDSAP